MTAVSAPDDAELKARLAALLSGADGAAEIHNLVPVTGGNARSALAFDAHWQNGRRLPCILLAQVAGKHVESDTAAEFAVLRALTGQSVRSPAAIALDADGLVTGAPALVLERLPGEASAVTFLREPDGRIGRARTGDLAIAAAELHRFDWRSCGLAAPSGNPALSEVEQWEHRFFRHRLEPLPVLAYLFRWLKAHVPAQEPLALVHGDLRPGNFLFAGERITALLDWEMAHIGDPAEDVAWIYRALWSPDAFMGLEEFAQAYAAHSGMHLAASTLLYYRIFSEVKFATISAAAAHGVASGQTLNLRHIDRASKIAEAVRLALTWIDSRNWESGCAAA